MVRSGPKNARTQVGKKQIGMGGPQGEDGKEDRKMRNIYKECDDGQKDLREGEWEERELWRSKIANL